MQYTGLIRLSGTAVLSFLVTVATAAVPAGYYATVDTSNATTLRATLHEAIDNHTRISYDDSPSSFAVLEDAEENPNNAAEVLDIYRNDNLTEVDGGSGDYNREHIWPRSLGFPDNSDTGRFPVSDLHALFLSFNSYNNARGNKFYDNCNGGCNEDVTVPNNGTGGGSGVYPGNSNWSDSDSWEVWQGRQGEAARALFYLDIRYEPLSAQDVIDGVQEPDLRLTDNTTLILNSNTGSNLPVAYMGRLSALLDWTASDPVDSLEFNRMEVVASAQDNRNPFVDFPEFADCLYNGDCSGVAPIRPDNVTVAVAGTDATIMWDARIESDLDGYNLYRSTTSGGPYTKLNGSLLTSTTYSDLGLSVGTNYYYVVTAVDTDANESTNSIEKAANLGSGSVIASQSFETTLGYTISTGNGSFNSGTDYFDRFDLSLPPVGLNTFKTGVDGSFFIAGEDTNGTPPLPSDGIHTVTLDPVTITGASGLSVTIALNALDDARYDSSTLSNGDYLRVFASIDGGSDVLIGQFTGVANPAASNAKFGQDTDLDGLGDVEISDYSQLQDYEFTVAGSGDDLVVKIVTRFESGSEEIVYDNIRINGTLPSSVSDWWVLH